jgi:hypothetical protein
MIHPMKTIRTKQPETAAHRTQYRVICGDAFDVLKSLPDGSADMCMTSPPYWGHREYHAEGIGLEETYAEYVVNLCRILEEVKRVLTPRGSLWLNIGDSYDDKNLVGVPWRVALHLTDHGGWFLRNDVIWNKVKGAPDNSRDKLRNIHEHVFHFVKQKKNYYYDVDSIRSNPKEAKVVNGSVISATGVSGVRYKRQIELSTALSPAEKIEALRALEAILDDVRAKRLADFRMIIRGQQRTTHSDSDKVSGRAKEIRSKGFYFLKYHPGGSKPSDVWDSGITHAIVSNDKLIVIGPQFRGRDWTNKTAGRDVRFYQWQRCQSDTQPIYGSLKLKVDMIQLKMSNWY